MATIRVALLLSKPEAPPDWCVRLVQQICSEDGIELTALLHAPASGPAGARNPLIRLWSSIEGRVLARSNPADRTAYSRISDGVPVIAAGDQAAIRACDLDVILDLAGGSGMAADPALARHGVWFFDFLRVDPAVAGMEQIMSGEPVTGIALFRHAAGMAEPAAIASARINSKFVAALNGLFMCEKAVALVMRALRVTRLSGSPPTEEARRLAPLSEPGMGRFISYLAGMIGTAVWRVVALVLARLRMRPGMYYLRFAESGWRDFDPARATALVLKGNRFLADPFLWERDGEMYCFFEEFDYATNQGHISVGRIANGELIETRDALRTGYHLSFPFLFEHGGDLFMLPETCAVHRLEVWKCVEFPDRWERHATALEGVNAADTTLTRIGDDWWLFTNIAHDPFGDMNSELHVFRVDGPDLIRIEPHATNPVVIDARTARNAGRILQEGGRLFRPSQDNSHGLYGYGLNVMEIEELSLETYREKPVRYIGPDFEPGTIGCHHLDSCSGRVVMDVRKRIGGFG